MTDSLFITSSFAFGFGLLHFPRIKFPYSSMLFRHADWTARDFVLIILVPVGGILVSHFLHISSPHSDLYSDSKFPFFDLT